MTTKIEFAPKNQARKSRLSRLFWVALLVMLAATAVNLGLYVVAGGLFPEVTAWPGSGPGQIVGANIVYLLIGTIIFAAITRLSSRPARHYLVFAVVGLLFSLALPISAGFGYGPPGTPPASTATVITLCLMHLVSFAISVPMFISLVLDRT